MSRWSVLRGAGRGGRAVLPPGVCQRPGRQGGVGSRGTGRPPGTCVRHGEHTQRVRLGRVLGRFKDKRTDVTGGPTWPADSASPARRAVSGSPSSPKASMGRRSAFGVFSSELLSLRSPRNRRSHCVMKLAPRALFSLAPPSGLVLVPGSSPAPAAGRRGHLRGRGQVASSRVSSPAL